MSIFDRLGDVIKSYLNDEDDGIFGKPRSNSPNDSDYHAAYEELNEYLNKDKARTYSWKDEDFDSGYNNKTAYEPRNNTSYTDYVKEEFERKQAERKAEREREKAGTEQKKSETRREHTAQNPRNSNSHVPEELRNDFAELGLAFGSSLIECKTSYKTLLKKHHPDRHAGHERNMKKATEKSARINVSYRRIEVWYETGKIN